jgi:aryl carrier-like protein
MVPVTAVVIDRIPLTPNGKIDRQRLLEIERERQEERRVVEPETEQERVLVDIIKQIMSIERVGVTDNLFEIGIDSLKIFQIASRANKQNIPLSPRNIMLSRTIRAALAEGAKNKAPLQAKMEIKAVPRDRMRRLSPTGGAAR